jgi:hypothetical protein
MHEDEAAVAEAARNEYSVEPLQRSLFVPNVRGINSHICGQGEKRVLITI